MAVEYDLVVIGATAAGIQAAIAAANLKARVALVTQGCTPTTGWETAILQGGAIGTVTASLSRTPWPPIAPDPAGRKGAWLQAAIANVNELQSPVTLASRGIDVVEGMGEFCRKPLPGLVAEGRSLRSRAYLLAVGCCADVPAIAGLATTDYVTPERLSDLLPTVPPDHHWGIWGTTLSAIALAQTLRQWGFPVTLWLPEGTELGNGDRDVVALLHAQVEAAGIHLCPAPIVQLQAQGNQTQVTTATQTITVDRLIVVGSPRPNVATLNLDAMAVDWEPHRLHQKANRQTTNPRIYACLGQVGQETFHHVACYEAAIAVKNALFWPRLQAKLDQVPLSVPTLPELAWVGQSEAAAKQQYGAAQVHVLHRPFYTVPAAQLRSDLTGFCKLVVRGNGKLVGAIAIGQDAALLTTLIALAMHHRQTAAALATLPIPTPAIANMLNQLGQDWQQYALTQKPYLEDWLDSLFDWRRSWSR